MDPAWAQVMPMRDEVRRAHHQWLHTGVMVRTPSRAAYEPELFSGSGECDYVFWGNDILSGHMVAANNVHDG